MAKLTIIQHSWKNTDKPTAVYQHGYENGVQEVPLASFPDCMSLPKDHLYRSWFLAQEKKLHENK